MIDQLCGADHGNGETCERQANHVQACPVCGRVTYMAIHSCPGVPQDGAE